MNDISVTKKKCKCGMLERWANNSNMPIAFDEETNEYSLEFAIGKDGSGSLKLRHCPFCGGKAPESLRAKLSTDIPSGEVRRLHELTRNIKTLEDATSAFGKPDFEAPQTETRHNRGDEEKSEETRSFTSLTYQRLSEIADVHITDFQERGVKVSFHGKYIGKKKPGNKA